MDAGTQPSTSTPPATGDGVDAEKRPAAGARSFPARPAALAQLRALGAADRPAGGRDPFQPAQPHDYPTSGNFQTIFGSQAVLLMLSLGLILR